MLRKANYPITFADKPFDTNKLVITFFPEVFSFRFMYDAKEMDE